jgi:enterobactin synthetase component D
MSSLVSQEFQRISLSTYPGDLPDAVVLLFDPSDGGAARFERFGIACPVSLDRAVTKRRAEYLAGRRVALHALREAGIAVADLDIGALRAPRWPDGYTGSITHSNTLAAAIAIPVGVVRGVGIDVEDVASDDAMSAIVQVALSATEWRVIDTLASRVGTAAAVTIAFSAKESFYKATSAVVGRVFDFSALRIASVHVESGVIEATITERLSPDLVTGQVVRLGFSLFDEHSVMTSYCWNREH